MSHDYQKECSIGIDILRKASLLTELIYEEKEALLTLEKSDKSPVTSKSTLLDDG